MTPRKRAPTPEDRALAFARVLRLVVDVAKEEFKAGTRTPEMPEGAYGISVEKIGEVQAACIAAATEFVKGADLGNDAGSR